MLCRGLNRRLASNAANQPTQNYADDKGDAGGPDGVFLHQIQHDIVENVRRDVQACNQPAPILL